MVASKGLQMTEDSRERLSSTDVLTREGFEKGGYLYVSILGSATLKIGERGQRFVRKYTRKGNCGRVSVQPSIVTGTERALCRPAKVILSKWKPKNYHVK